jgi:hypothetical protein
MAMLVRTVSLDVALQRAAYPGLRRRIRPLPMHALQDDEQRP